MFLIVVAVGVGLAVGLAAPSGRTPMIIPWLVLCAPSITLVSLLVLAVGDGASPVWQALIAIFNGVLYGAYALLAFLPTRWPLVVTLVFHTGSILLGLALMMMNC